MDVLDLALQQYDQMRQTNDRIDSGGEALSQWVRSSVIPLIGRLAKRADFRQLARATIDTLSPGSDTEARRLVDEIDAHLVNTARLSESIESSPQLSEAIFVSFDEQHGTPHPKTERATTVADSIATRPWRDLVSGATAGERIRPRIEIEPEG